MLESGDYTLIPVKEDNLFFVSAMKSENSPLMVVEFTNKIIALIKAYIGSVTEVKIRSNFSLVYQVDLDETRSSVASRRGGGFRCSRDHGALHHDVPDHDAHHDEQGAELCDEGGCSPAKIGLWVGPQRGGHVAAGHHEQQRELASSRSEVRSQRNQILHHRIHKRDGVLVPPSLLA